MAKKCAVCGQNISDELIAERKRLRGLNVSKGLASAKARGEAIGRPRSIDRKKIYALRSKGFSMRKIADHIGCSTYSVKYALDQKP